MHACSGGSASLIDHKGGQVFSTVYQHCRCPCVTIKEMMLGNSYPKIHIVKDGRINIFSVIHLFAVVAPNLIEFSLAMVPCQRLNGVE